MHEFQFGPCQKALAQGLEERLQVRRGALLMQRWRFHLLVDVEVHERHRQRRQRELFADQPAIDLGLGPVQRAVIGRDRGDVALVRLDFLQQAALGIEAVDATAHGQRAMRYLSGLVAS